jgi:DNA-binding transcriptional MerR regulator
MGGAGDEATRQSITSEGLPRNAVLACWVIALALLGAGITATFLAGTGAAPAAMILFGSLFAVLALMKRVPLSLEVGGAKFDASYERAEAFDAGREVGVQQGVEVALDDVEKAEERGESPHLALERRRDAWQSISWQARLDLGADEAQVPEGSYGYRGPTACNAAGISYRQLDYWARTGLVEPSVRSGGSRLYTERDIVLLRVIKQLLDAGVSLQQIRTVVVHIHGRTASDLKRMTLLSDGRSIYEATTSDEVFDVLQSGRGTFGIAISGVVREVRESLGELSAERIRPEGPPEPA